MSDKQKTGGISRRGLLGASAASGAARAGGAPKCAGCAPCGSRGMASDTPRAVATA